MESSPASSSTPPLQRRFVTTQWSLILAAGHKSSPDADAALELLCSRYWYPLYVFARRRGASPDDAADQTQEFLSRLVEKEYLRAADRQRGRFRTFLLTMFQRFLASEYHRQLALKRGGSVQTFSIDAGDGERRYAFEPCHDATAESLYERRWALTTLSNALDRLRSEYAQKGKAMQFEKCQPYLAGAGDGPGYTRTAAELKMSEVAVRVAVHRLRERYRQLLRDEVAGTVDDPDEIDEELLALRLAISGENS